MMKKEFFILFMFISLSHLSMASVDHISYKATFGIFGTVGSIKNKITKNAKTYEIETDVRFQGLAKVLLGGQRDHYISRGKIKNGLMISDTYIMTSIKKNKKKIKEYSINHKTKQVTKRVREWKKGKLVKDKKQTLNFYAKDDLLTLYFNLGTAVTKRGKKYHFKAVGLEKQNGKVQITVPSKSNQEPYIKDLGNGAMLYAKALIHQKNFKGNKGDILLSLAKDKYIEKSVIKDVVLYGDARIERLR